MFMKTNHNNDKIYIYGLANTRLLICIQTITKLFIFKF